MDIEKEAIYDTDVVVMGTDGLWDVTSNERVAEIVQRSLEQFPPEDAARYRYRFTSAAQDLVMSSRGKLVERSWRTSDNKSATIDDISVFVIPLLQYKEKYLCWKQEQEERQFGEKEASGDHTAAEMSSYVSFSTELSSNLHKDTEDSKDSHESDEALLENETPTEQLLMSETEPKSEEETLNDGSDSLQIGAHSLVDAHEGTESSST